MTAADDAISALCGQVVEAARNAAPAIVTAAQADAQAALAALQTQLTELQAVETNVQTQLDDANAQVRQGQADLAALQAKYDAYVASHPDPAPAVQPLMVGGTLRGTNAGNALTQPRPVWDIVRCYNQGEALAVKQPSTIAVSYTPESSPGFANSTTTLATLKSHLQGLPDWPGVRVDFKHEFDNPSKYGPDAQSYLADADAFAKLVRAVSATRKNPLVIYRCCMAFSISQPSRNLDAFYATGDYDEIGCDVYSIKQITDAVTFAAKHGKPLCVPEMGPLSAVPQNDPAMLAYAQQGVSAFKAAGATWLTWFDKNGAGADLDQYPNTLAFLKSQL